jgi:hypothetical protein
MKWQSLPALVLVALAGAAAPGASQASDPTAQLGVWQGQWTYTEHDYETPYSHAHTDTGTANCNWSPNHGFMVCDYLNSNPANGVPANDLAAFSYSPAAKAYTRVGIFKDGKPSLDRVAVQGSTWTTSVEIPYNGKMLIHRNVHIFSSDDKQASATTEVSADNGKTWTTLSRFTSVKVAS